MEHEILNSNFSLSDSQLVVATPGDIKRIIMDALHEYLSKPLFCGEKVDVEDDLLTREETAELLFQLFGIGRKIILFLVFILGVW